MAPTAQPDKDVLRVIELAGIRREDITDKVYTMADHLLMTCQMDTRMAAKRLTAWALMQP